MLRYLPPRERVRAPLILAVVLAAACDSDASHRVTGPSRHAAGAQGIADEGAVDPALLDSLTAATSAVPDTGVPIATIRFTLGTLPALRFQMPVGSTQQFSAAAYDSAGRLIPSRRVVLQSVRPAVLSLDASGGAVALAPGYALLSATAGSKTEWVQFQTVEAAAAPIVTQTGSVDTVGAVRVAVRRFDGRTGAVAVGTGIPLAPGALRAGNLAGVRLTLQGGGAAPRAGGLSAEVPIAVTALAGRHPDGSLRAILVQFQAGTLGASDVVPGWLALGTRAGNTPRPASATIAPVAPSTVPDAALLPTDPAYLVATDIVGPARTTAASAALGTAFRGYEDRFAPAEARHWAAEGANWVFNYYDRALLYYAAWARTGNATFWHRGTQMAVNYRRDYLEANAYGSSAHWSQLEGVEKHYLLTGDEASRTAVARVAHVLRGYQPRLSDPNFVDPRVVARVIQGTLLAWRLAEGAPFAASVPVVDLRAQLDDQINKLVAYQQPNGRFPTNLGTCGGQQAYMAGLLGETITEVHRYYRADARLVTTLQRSADYLWNTQWIPGEASFRLADWGCAGMAASTPSPDLSGLIVHAYAYLARVTGDAKYRTQGDAIFAGMSRAYLEGSKQFTQSYATAYRYVGDR